MNIGLIAPYPPQKSVHSHQSGEAWYSKKLAEALDQEKVKVVVLANRLGSTTTKYYDRGVNVERCWDFGFKAWFQICAAVIRQRKQLDVLHVQFAIFVFGGFSSAVTFPLFLLVMRILRIKVVITFHQTVPLSNIDKHFEEETGIRGNPAILRRGLYAYIKILGALVETIIVHEPFFREVLVRDYGIKNEKINIVPIGIDEVEAMTDSKLAKSILKVPENKPVVLFFGYLAKYKGLDTLIDAIVSDTENDCILLVAGGEHPRMQKTKEYEKYISMLHEKAARAPGRVVFTGFVTEDRIPCIFAASDIVVFPYTRAISSSGPLSLSVAYNKPFLASEPLKTIISEPAIIFPNTAEGIRKMIGGFLNDEAIKKRAMLYALSLLKKRRWDNIALKTVAIYKETTQACDFTEKGMEAIPVTEIASFNDPLVFEELFTSYPQAKV
jgi:glycosyltransferase involved in cell wall biosynthesis